MGRVFPGDRTGGGPCPLRGGEGATVRVDLDVRETELPSLGPWDPERVTDLLAPLEESLEDEHLEWFGLCFWASTWGPPTWCWWP